MTARLSLLLSGILLVSLSMPRAVAHSDFAQGTPTMLSALPPLTETERKPAEGDWLVAPIAQTARAGRGDAANELILTNGLIRRVWRVTPNAATVALDCLTTKESFVRGVKPEASLTLDGTEYAVGGLMGQPDYAYLRSDWIDRLTADPKAFRCVGVATGGIAARFPWKQARYASNTTWPPRGASVTLKFAPPDGLPPELTVDVHYEMYDGIPVLAKWVTVTNGTGKPIRLNAFKSEILATVEPEAYVEEPTRWEYPNLHVDSDYAFQGMDPKSASKTVHWVPDPQYETQVNYNRKTPNLLECRPPLGPDVDIAPGTTFTTFRTFELLYDSTERERRGLALRRMYRVLAPWATENPILMHARNADPQTVRNAIDQCAEVGFEMVILSFGSGFNMESEDPAYRRTIRELVDYGRSKGVELGGYSLLASRRINDDEDVIHPKTGKTGGAIFGNSPCLCGRWGQDYFRKVKSFIEETCLRLVEHDGSYPGDVCASTAHPGHRGLNDSQWRQWEAITDFYRWCRERGVYLNVPDWYFLNGSNKTGMGYRETNWSLPREQQFILGRQNIYDGTWFKAPSMGWMFVPLSEYHGGGAAATLEPLKDHLDAYGQHLAQNFMSGVQACYRGPRLFDSPETKAVVRRWVDLYKKHRPLLDADVIHLARPDGRNLDGLLHVDPFGKEKGLAVLHNPTNAPITTDYSLPLYYTGLTKTARIRIDGGKPRSYKLDRTYRATVPLTVPAHGMTWLLIE
ncbi:MAG: hypothetical protein SFU56_14905 [Capsulimonadales bacterium]|nr:hypothetical protein [Capsulimonadales bacterium]